MSTLSFPFLSLLVLVTLLLATALIASKACRDCQNGTTTENFDADQTQPAISLSKFPVVKGVDGEKYDRIQILDGSKKELGWCLSIDGRVQMCQADTHKYHEMLVQFACAVRDLGPENAGKAGKKDDNKLTALILYGGDGLAKAQVVSTKRFGKVVVLDDERGVSELRNSMSASPQIDDYDSSEELYGSVKQSLQGFEPGSFDLIVVDLKDRFLPESDRPMLSRSTCRQLSKLLTRGGVLSVGSMLPAASKWKGGIDELADDPKCFEYRLPFTFYSEVRSGHVKMELFADWDMYNLLSGLPSGGLQKLNQNTTQSSSSTTPPQKLKFFDPTKPLSYYIVPWLASL
jgi:spermidine synthase